MEGIIKGLIAILIGVNVGGFIGSLFFKGEKERPIASFATASVITCNILLFFILFLWGINGFSALSVHLATLYEYHQYAFDLNLLLDEISAVFLIVGNTITLLIIYFSRRYLHREKGYKRFFNTILFFYLAYNLVSLAGNLVTMFMGWEYLGISSFLLVAFYRERYLPVKNAVKIFSVYRMGDVAFIMAIWLFNQVTHYNFSFDGINSVSFVDAYLADKENIRLVLSLLFLFTAVVKSAQFPFIYWIPRAMEGPTPSSAIFYGSLSIHMGILLLFRTYYIWEPFWLTRVLFGIIGLLTVLMANPAALVQSSVKTQIAYSSVTQIGFMFIELALGLKWLVLIHFMSNAYLRTYQLIVSPSVAAYLLHQQAYFSRLIQAEQKLIDLFPRPLRKTIYVLAQKEWNLDYIVTRYLFGMVKKTGRRLYFIHFKTLFAVIIPIYALMLYMQMAGVKLWWIKQYVFPLLLSCVAFLLSVRAYAERYSVDLVLFLMVISQLFILLSISFNESYPSYLTWWYLPGVIAGFLVCITVIIILRQREGAEVITLNKYYGHGYEYPAKSVIFLLGILCVIGFPITTTFIAEDIILEHVGAHQFLLAFFVAVTYLFTGINGIRAYARIFLGPHYKHYHTTALKSA